MGYYSDLDIDRIERDNSEPPDDSEYFYERALKLEAELAAAKQEAITMATWQPIATAPKSGDDLVAIPILAFCPEEYNGNYGSDERIRVIWWEPRLNGGCWRDDRDLDECPRPPTHWMPLPAPPSRADND